MEIKAAIAQTRSARRHSIPVKITGALRGSETMGESRGKAGTSLIEPFDEALPADAATVSGIATRIWGAPHCRQKALPSSMLCPHL
jgi:hypothetical protein